MTRRIFYPGSFDPCTRGHLDLCERALRFADEVIVGVGANPSKSALFSPAERQEMLDENLGHLADIRVVTFTGLAVEAAREEGCAAILRGIRNSTDFDYELTMAQTNQKLSPKIETICLLPDPRFAMISSRLIKEVYRFQGEVEELLPESVARRVKEKFGDR